MFPQPRAESDNIQETLCLGTRLRTRLAQRLRVRLYDVFGAAINDAALVAARRHREGRTAGQTKTLVHKKRPARITAATVSGWEAGDRPQIARGVNGKAATASAFLEGPEA